MRIERSACGKIILCGEHAVVYGRPAIALPLSNLRARALIEPAGRLFHIAAVDLGKEYDLETHPAHPLACIARVTLDFVHQAAGLVRLTLASDIPIGAHLGSSAAVSVACARAVAAYYGRELTPEEASALAFEAEKIYHGTPSGIDNTVVAWEQPIWFTNRPSPASARQSPLIAPQPPCLVIADTGIHTPSKIPIADVRIGWEAEPQRQERLFDRVGDTVMESRNALLAGDWPRLGRAMDANQALLIELGVSCPELDGLCDAARQAGALGAKLSGAGRGGNMIALARDAGHAGALREALSAAGARRVI